MNEDEIKALFYLALEERNVHLKLGKTKSYVSHLRNDHIPKIGTMLEILYKLRKIKVIPNVDGGETS